MRRVALVTSHFPPSNLVSGHRARLWANHLEEFGWKPVIVTTHWKYYEEPLDPELDGLVSPDVEVIRTRAFPVKPLRLIGDAGVRAFPWHLAALNGLASRRRIDFVHITIPSNFCAPLGRILWRRHSVPYGIDFQDPWVHEWPGIEKPLTRAWASYHLAKRLEPWSLRQVRLITAVGPGYIEGMIERHPEVRESAVIRTMPVGISESDFDRVRSMGKRAWLFDNYSGGFHMIYAGALLPRAMDNLDAFLKALVLLCRRDPESGRRLHVHFVGTAASGDEPAVSPLAKQLGVAHMVHEHPRRIAYCDVLNHLTHASAILVLGSTEKHYLPSKLAQALLAGKPILAILRAGSEGADLLQQCKNTVVVPCTGEAANPEAIVNALHDLMQRQRSELPLQPDIAARLSARESARSLAAALDEAMAH